MALDIGANKLTHTQIHAGSETDTQPASETQRVAAELWCAVWVRQCDFITGKSCDNCFLSIWPLRAQLRPTRNVRIALAHAFTPKLRNCEIDFPWHPLKHTHTDTVRIVMRRMQSEMQSNYYSGFGRCEHKYTFRFDRTRVTSERINARASITFG